MSAGPDGGGAAAAQSREGSPAKDGFVPSALGTREHWDAVYERELQTFQEYGDTGEIWFGEESMNRLIKWMQKHKIPLDASVLDIGTGNGVFLVELAKFGFSNITGIDYSPSAIQLSGNIIEKEGLSNINLKVEDFLNLSTKLSGFHICIDKGTFDAISLNPDNAVEKRKQYVKSLSSVLRVKGFFLITSCNWTKEELLNEFSEGPKAVPQLGRLKCFASSLQKTDSQENMMIASDLLGETGNKSGSSLEASPFIRISFSIQRDC
ncbi:EEF1A lysine methyltransferase 2 isoform 1-T1 [Callospermophilus lateralis]|uniref:EEF1A lysine methyltransferase 2 isoform X1 n=1 Tax=Callospermophilus lateralis TaxID=76772 RepID=UPI004053CBD6